MKTRPAKNQKKIAPLYPPPFCVEELTAAQGRIPFTTGKKKNVSINDIADGLEQLLQEASQQESVFVARLHAFNVLLSLLNVAIWRFNQIAGADHELSSHVAMGSPWWPVLYSNTLAGRRRIRELFLSLGVGKRAIPSAHSKIDPQKNPSWLIIAPLVATIMEAQKMHLYYELFSEYHPALPAPGWRRDALKLPALPTNKAGRAEWKRVAEKALKESGYDASQFGREPKATNSVARKGSYLRSKFWTQFDSLLRDAEKLQTIQVPARPLH